MLDIINNFIASFRTIAGGRDRAPRDRLRGDDLGPDQVPRSHPRSSAASVPSSSYGVINIDTLQTKVEEDVTNEGEFTP